MSEYIPKNCFIDMRKFNTTKDIFDYIKNLDNNTYEKYIKSINKFLTTKKYHKFDVDFNMNILFKKIH